MPIPESERYSFIVRFWRQPGEIAAEPPAWRGWIEDAANGERRYFLTFQEMLLFMVETMHLQPEDVQALTFPRPSKPPPPG